MHQYEYNARGQIIGIADGNRNPVSYDVDSWGRITGVSYVDGVKEGYEYTPANRISRTVDSNGSSCSTDTTALLKSVSAPIRQATKK